MNVGFVLGILKKWCFFVFGMVPVFSVIRGDSISILPNTDYRKNMEPITLPKYMNWFGIGTIPVWYRFGRDLGLVAHP